MACREVEQVEIAASTEEVDAGLRDRKLAAGCLDREYRLFPAIERHPHDTSFATSPRKQIEVLAVRRYLRKAAGGNDLHRFSAGVNTVGNRELPHTLEATGKVDPSAVVRPRGSDAALLGEFETAARAVFDVHQVNVGAVALNDLHRDAAAIGGPSLAG